MEKQSKILITGASGLIGSALVRLLKADGYENLLTPRKFGDELDCRWQDGVSKYFQEHHPDYVFHLAAYVGGIQSNINEPARFSWDNTMMISTILWACHLVGVKKLLFPGSACAYPVLDRQIKEEDFLSGKPEPTNIAYAVAKINGIIMAQSFAKQHGMKVVLPMVANTYGIGDKSTHVIPQMIERLKKNEPYTMFRGSGNPIREFIYADDVADAFLFLMKNYDSPEIVNVGTENTISIRELSRLIATVVGYKGGVGFEHTQADGTPKKSLDCSKIRSLGWVARVGLRDGIERVVNADI